MEAIDTTTERYRRVVNERYSASARVAEPGLCCPAEYNPELLKIIPPEVIERDYGCGDPSPYVREGETVLDLGSGGGKLCFIAAQLVGAAGKVIGVDMNDEMLSLARGALPEVARALGYQNVEFRKGRIEDLSIDHERVDAYLKSNPVSSAEDLGLLEEALADLRARAPLVAPNSVDVVLSNCVLNLVAPSLKARIFPEIHRVLKPGGRAIISDVVSDEDIPEHLQEDPKLWGGCISGAIREDRFLEHFAAVGLYGIEILAREDAPYEVIEGIKLRKITVAAYKGKEGPCWDHKQAVIYKGPFLRVEDDDGHVLERGKPVAVCEKTLRIFSREPYARSFALVQPDVPVRPEDAQPFECGPAASLGAAAAREAPAVRLRAPGELKNDPARQKETVRASSNCCDAGGCC